MQQLQLILDLSQKSSMYDEKCHNIKKIKLDRCGSKTYTPIDQGMVIVPKMGYR